MRCLAAITCCSLTRSKTRSIHKMLAAGALLCAFSGIPFCQTQQNPIVLKDPTPRPPDLEKVYGVNQADQARQQQAAMLRNAQIREEVVKATGKICQLAQQLRDDVARGGDGTTAADNAARAAQIEKLAKSVKEKTQMQ